MYDWSYHLFHYSVWEISLKMTLTQKWDVEACEHELHWKPVGAREEN